jgi:hypothetical protein
MKYISIKQAEEIQTLISPFNLELVINKKEFKQYILNKTNNTKALLVVKYDKLWLSKGIKQYYKNWDNFTSWLELIKGNNMGFKVVLPSNLWTSDCTMVSINEPFNLVNFLKKHKVEENKIKRAINVFNSKYSKLTDLPLKVMKATYISILKEKQLIY